MTPSLRGCNITLKSRSYPEDQYLSESAGVGSVRVGQDVQRVGEMSLLPHGSQVGEQTRWTQVQRRSRLVVLYLLASPGSVFVAWRRVRLHLEYIQFVLGI